MYDRASTPCRGRPQPRLATTGLACLLAAMVAVSGCGASASYHTAPSSYEHTPAQDNAGRWDHLERQAARGHDVQDGAATGQSATSDRASSAPEPMMEVQATSKRPSHSRPPPAARHSPGPKQVGTYSPGKAASSTPDQGGNGQQRASEAKAAPQRQTEAPLVVYLGYLKLRVKRLLDAVDAATHLAQQTGGYVESLSGQVLILRVPAHDFDGVMTRFAALGEVLDRRVKALDVTKQFTDLDARMTVAVEARTRLLLLLKTVKDVEERLQVLEEIKRLTEQIEIAESSLATLRNLASYFTITLDLEPVMAQVSGQAHRSAFPWVRQLQPHMVTIEDGKDDATLTLPRGFVLFDDDDVWRAQAADTSMLRIGVVDNEPKGDAAFWIAAVQHEMEGRDEELVDTASVATAGKLEMRVWHNKDARPRYHLVGVQTMDKKLYVIEAFFPNEAAWQLHREGVRKALATFRGK